MSRSSLGQLPPSDERALQSEVPWYRRILAGPRKACTLVLLAAMAHALASPAEAQCSWQPLGAGMGGADPVVEALTVYRGELIAGGSFTTAGGVSVNNIARWNGTSWQGLGTGITGGAFPRVEALAVFEGELIVAGAFTTAGGVGANNVARWNGSTWQPLGAGIAGGVWSLTIYNGELVAGGLSVRRWTGATWAAFSPTPGLSDVLALTVYDDELIAGGATAGTGSTDWWRWDGATWTGVGCGGEDEAVVALHVFDGDLFIGGVANEGCDIGRWRNGVYLPIGSGMNDGVYALGEYNCELVAGGAFTNADGVGANRIARWNGTNWQNLGAGVTGGSFTHVASIAVFNGRLIVGGSFTSAGAVGANHIAQRVCSNLDSECDSIIDSSDNCPLDFNPLQEDSDGNGVGNACEVNETEQLFATGSGGGDMLGTSADVDGLVAVVGVPGDDDLGTDAGAAFVFHFDGNNWVDEQKLLASDGMAGDTFGRSVAVDGDVIFVGADGAEAVYVFRWNGASWVEEDILTEGARAAGDLFGWSVAIDGDYAIIGSYADDDHGVDAGAAFVYQQVAGSWNFTMELTPADAAGGDHFGWDVDISGDGVIVGAPGDDDNGADSGSAYVFRRSGAVWSEEDKLLPADGAAGDEFGYSVAIDGTNALIGAPGDDDNGADSGSAYVFTDDGAGNWGQDQKLLASDGSAGDRFGSAVALFDNVAIIGSYADDDHGQDSGSAYAFLNTGTGWEEQCKLLPDLGAPGDQFGNAVAISPPHVTVGASAADTQGVDSGTAYIFGLASIEAEPPVAQEVAVPKNRYISFRPRNDGTVVAIQVEHLGSGTTAWVDVPDGNGLARLTDTPVFREWTEVEVHVGDCEIAPVASYEVRATVDGTTFTAPLSVSTIAQPGARFWGDTVGGFVAGAWTPPDGNVNGFDIVAVIKKFQVDPAAPHITWADLNPVVPDKLANGQDILQVVNAFSQAPYPFVQPENCP